MSGTTVKSERVCPLCGTKGQVSRSVVIVREAVVRKPDRVAAALTLGLSRWLFPRTQSRRRRMVQTHCGACGSTWEI